MTTPPTADMRELTGYKEILEEHVPQMDDSIRPTGEALLRKLNRLSEKDPDQITIKIMTDTSTTFSRLITKHQQNKGILISGSKC